MRLPIPYGKQHITQEDIDAVTYTLGSNYLTQGPRIEEFEDNFACYVGAKYAVAVANGTAALHLSALALQTGKGDRVITTPITFTASANCIMYAGGEVHFADIDPNTYKISIDCLKQLLERHPKGYYSGIIPVDFTGYPVDLEQLKELADHFGLWILEDACHAPGGYFYNSHGKKQYCGDGRDADLAIFSFHPVKHIAAGEGGMITTNNKQLYEKLLVLRTHGITKNNLQLDFPNPQLQGDWYYEMQELGYNYRITDIQAALGNSQLKRADQGLKRRREIAENYRQAFRDTSIKMQSMAPGFEHAYHLFVIEVTERKALYDYLRSQQIFAQVHYIPVHLMPYYKNFGWKEGDFPKAEHYYQHCLSLPMYPSLTDQEQEYVIEKVLNFANG